MQPESRQQWLLKGTGPEWIRRHHDWCAVVSPHGHRRICCGKCDRTGDDFTPGGATADEDAGGDGFDRSNDT